MNLGFLIAYSFMFKRIYKLEPQNSQLNQALILLPKSLTFIYGAIVDTVPLCGMHMRYWWVFMGILQFAFLFYTSIQIPD
jgi:hypothetical protein